MIGKTLTAVCLHLFTQICQIRISSSEDGAIPIFTTEPPRFVYFAEEGTLSVTGRVNFKFSIAVIPTNVTITAHILNSTVSKHPTYLPVIQHNVKSEIMNEERQNPYILLETHTAYSTVQQFFSIHAFHMKLGMTLHILATNNFGTVCSRPVTLKSVDLPNFPRYSNEHLSLLIGNTGRVICHLPHSQPSLPSVNFYYNGKLLDIRKESRRYRLIYIGGDGTGVPWDNHHHPLPGSHNEPNFWHPIPSAAILLIHSLQMTDSGEYQCEAELMGKRVLSEQKTILTITKPTGPIQPFLRFSSQDPELSYLYDPFMEAAAFGSHAKTWNFPVGYNLTLFCLFEGAPIVPTQWYFESSATQVFGDDKFGILSIGSMNQKHEGTYKCSTQSTSFGLISRTFNLKVRVKSKLSIEPNGLIKVSIGGSLRLRCHTSPDDASGYLGQLNSNRTESLRFWWLFNGNAINRIAVLENVRVDDNNLHINDFTEQNAGIYQCWSADQWDILNTASCAVIPKTLLLSEAVKSNYETISPAIFREHTEEGLTGHLTCNISMVNLSDYMSTRELLFVWYRNALSVEPIDVSEYNKKAGRIKYLTSQVSRDSQVLSIVNPEEFVDAGSYICKIYEARTRTFLGQVNFELSIGSLKANPIENDEKLRSKIIISDQDQAMEKLTTSDQSQSEKSIDESVATKFVAPSTQTAQIINVQVHRLEQYSTAVYIKWDVSHSVLQFNINRYSLEYRRKINPSYSSVTVPFSNGSFDWQNKSTLFTRFRKSLMNRMSESWSVPLRTNVSTPSREICLPDAMYFHPGGVYSLRVIGYSEASENTGILNVAGILSSDWSESLSFEDLMDIRPSITDIVSANSSSVLITWTLPTTFFSQHATLRESDFQIRMKYTMFYEIVERRSILNISWLKCGPNLDGFNKTNKTIKNIRGFLTRDSKPEFRTIISQLLSNSRYVFSVYVNDLYRNTVNEFQMCTLLSEPVFYSTRNMKTQEESVYVPDRESSNTSAELERQLHVFKLHRNVIGEDQFYVTGSHVLVVVLGSLAGILMIIAIALIALCLWCQFRSKQMIAQDLSESPLKYQPGTSLTDTDYQWNGHLSGVDTVRLPATVYQPEIVDSSANTFASPFRQTSYHHPNWSTLVAQRQVSQYSTFSNWSFRTGCSALDVTQSHITKKRFANNQHKPNGCEQLHRFSMHIPLTWNQMEEGIPNEKLGADRGPCDLEVARHLSNEGAVQERNDEDSSIYSKVGSNSTLDEFPPKIFETSVSLASTNGIKLSAHCVEDSNMTLNIARPIPLYLTSTTFPRATFNPTFSNSDSEESRLKQLQDQPASSTETINLTKLYSEKLVKFGFGNFMLPYQSRHAQCISISGREKLVSCETTPSDQRLFHQINQERAEPLNNQPFTDHLLFDAMRPSNSDTPLIRNKCLRETDHEEEAHAYPKLKDKTTKHATRNAPVEINLTTDSECNDVRKPQMRSSFADSGVDLQTSSNVDSTDGLSSTDQNFTTKGSVSE